MVYADLVRPSLRRSARLVDLALVVAGSLLLALSARVAIPLPFSPVPVTGQTLAVLLLGALLGSRRGPSAILLYLLAGALGLPGFAGGAAGLGRLAGPTGGYLVGFAVAAFLTGLLAERGWDRRAPTAFLAMLLGNGAVYACGLPWLAAFVGFDRVLALGLLPFVPGDLFKLVLATLVLPAGWRLLGQP